MVLCHLPVAIIYLLSTATVGMRSAVLTGVLGAVTAENGGLNHTLFSALRRGTPPAPDQREEQRIKRKDEFIVQRERATADRKSRH